MKKLAAAASIVAAAVLWGVVGAASASADKSKAEDPPLCIINHSMQC